MRQFVVMVTYLPTNRKAPVTRCFGPFHRPGRMRFWQETFFAKSGVSDKMQPEFVVSELLDPRGRL